MTEVFLIGFICRGWFTGVLCYVITVIHIHCFSVTKDRNPAAVLLLEVGVLASYCSFTWVSCQFTGFKFGCPGILPLILGALLLTSVVLLL